MQTSKSHRRHVIAWQTIQGSRRLFRLCRADGRCIHMVRVIEQPYVPQHLINYARSAQKLLPYSRRPMALCGMRLCWRASPLLHYLSRCQGMVLCVPPPPHIYSGSAYQEAHSMPPRIWAKNLGVTFRKSLNKRSRFTQDRGLYPSLINALTYLSILIATILRQSFFLFATWAAKGWGPLAFTALMHPGPVSYVPPTLSSRLTPT